MWMVSFLTNCLIGVRNAAEHENIASCRHELALFENLHELVSLKKMNSPESIDNYITQFVKGAEASGSVELLERAHGFYRALASECTFASDAYFREIDSRFARILQVGGGMLQRAIEVMEYRWIYCEADHLHNIPHYAFGGEGKSSSYYFDAELPLYCEKLIGLGNPTAAKEALNVYRPLWAVGELEEHCVLELADYAKSDSL